MRRVEIVPVGMDKPPCPRPLFRQAQGDASDVVIGEMRDFILLQQQFRAQPLPVEVEGFLQVAVVAGPRYTSWGSISS